MTTWILKKISTTKQSYGWQGITTLFAKDRLLFGTLLLGLLLIHFIDANLFALIANTLSDAYLGVSVFVALTLGAFYTLDRYLKTPLIEILNRQRLLQVPVAAVLGALPGCGGAIIVATQFVSGKASFGALVAVLIATMGDAAFLLIAKKPEVAMAVYGISLVAGIVFGQIINWIHGYDYLKDASKPETRECPDVPRLPKGLTKLFLLLLVPGTLFGFLEAFQVDSNALFGSWAAQEPVKWLGFTGALLCVAVWMSQPLDSWSVRFTCNSKKSYLREAVVAETSFVSVWVILGFLCYELLIYFTQLDLHSQFVGLGAYTILLAIVIGFIPGCGPQIVMTTLYINGIIPLSAQLANAISNDGDALFPAIALAPKAAIKATLYSAIPAFILGYSAFYMGW